MKKSYFSLFVAAMMLAGTSSCTQEDGLIQVSGEMTTFKISLEGASHSRKAGDGMTVDSLYYEVYQGTTKILDNHGTDANAAPVAISKGSTSVDMPLLRGEKYKIMFWAQNKNSIYTATNLQEITIDYTKANTNNAYANKEAYDAFFYGDDDFQATSNVTTIELKRPFGQLNIGTSLKDWNNAKAVISGTDAPVTASQISVKGLAKNFNVLTGKASVDAGDVTFQMSTLEDLSTFEVKKDGEDKEYQHLSMNYLLVPTSNENVHKSNVNINATFRRGTLDLFSIALPNVPIERNWRTNIIGDLLATDKTFEIIIDAEFAGNEIIPDNATEELIMAAALGGQVTLTEDVVLSTPLNVKHDMTINLNGHSISNTTDLWNKEAGNWSLISVQNGSTLTIKGEGELNAKENDCFAVDVKDGSTVNIEGGKYVGNISAVYVHKGTANIKGGEFSIQQLASGNSYEQTLNCLDDNYDNQTAKIVVTGGKFYKFNPENCKAEGENTNFVPEGYETKTNGDWTTVIGEVVDYVEFDDHAEVYTSEGLLTWLNTITNEADKADFEVKLMSDIDMGKKAIVKDPVTGNYVYSDQEITFDDYGVPSGSNWIPLNSEIDELSDGFKGTIDGNDNTISGLIINKTTSYTGLVGFMYDGGVIKNLTIKDAVIYGGDNTGIVGGRSQNGNLIENIHVINSRIHGGSQVGGIVGYNYRRDRTDINEDFAYIKNCSTDADTKIVGTGNNVGGICGYNYGSIIVNCVNNADVTGKSSVGGIVGYCRDYWAKKSDASIVADAYVIACSSTDEASLTATNGSVGGIMGYGLADVPNHSYTWNFAVACYSASDLSGQHRGSFIGEINKRTKIVGSWAVKKDNVDKLVGSYSDNAVIAASNHYVAATDITENIVNEMNNAISEFNTTNAEGIQCTYKWEWVSGEWPKLVANN